MENNFKKQMRIVVEKLEDRVRFSDFIDSVLEFETGSKAEESDRRVNKGPSEIQRDLRGEYPA